MTDKAFKGYEPETFEAYFAQVKGRMEKGAREYGETSFSKSPSRLAIEIREEVEDISGWASIVWARVIQLAQKARLLEAEIAELERRRDMMLARNAKLEALDAKIQDSPEG